MKPLMRIPKPLPLTAAAGACAALALRQTHDDRAVSAAPLAA